MKSELNCELHLRFTEAAREVPGGPVHVQTIHRWAHLGVCGIQLESILVGRRRVTSREALLRFIAAVTAAAEKKSASHINRSGIHNLSRHQSAVDSELKRRGC